MFGVVSFMILFLLPFVLSAPPVTTINTIDRGFIIKYPGTESYAKNQTITFNFHVINITDGLPITSGITCYFHLYNQSGNHIYTLHNIATLDYSFDYQAKVLGSNFTKTGHYSYAFQCNSTSLGGFIENAIEVTQYGEIPTTSKAIIFFCLVAIILFFLTITLLLFLEIDNTVVRFTCMCLGYLLLVALNYIGWVISDNFIYANTFIKGFFWIVFEVLMFLALPLLLGFFAWYFLSLMKIKEIQDLIDKGIPEKEARWRVEKYR